MTDSTPQRGRFEAPLFGRRCAHSLLCRALLPGLASLTAVALVACEGGQSSTPPPPPTSGRSNAVLATDAGKASTNGTAVAVGSTRAVASAAPRPKPLCTEPAQTRTLPKGPMSTLAAPSAASPPANIAFGAGKWIWVNLWAAWCVPCREEMPRLAQWKEKLGREGVLLDVAFVSIDDDERQATRFLEGQPQGGVRSTYWLPEGTTRTTWLAAFGFKEGVELPLHALVAPSGQVACTIQGAVEDADYPALAAFFKAAH